MLDWELVLFSLKSASVLALQVQLTAPHNKCGSNLWAKTSALWCASGPVDGTS